MVQLTTILTLAHTEGLAAQYYTMGAKYYYYPVTSTGRSKPAKVYERGYGRSSPSRDGDTRPETPSLSRTSSLSSVGPKTPTFRSVSPADHKSRRRNVAFASPVAEAFRRPAEDELSVMRRFASHTHHCNSCEEALKSRSSSKNLCDRGFTHAKDLGRYFYCSDGKPFSETDKRMGRERVQVEVPGEYENVKHLFYALDNGLNLGGRPKSSRPEIHQSSKYPLTSRSGDAYSRTEVRTPTQYELRNFDNGSYDIRPSKTDSYRPREPVYQKRGSRSYETRTPYDDVYTGNRQTPIITAARSPPTSKHEKYYASRSKDDIYYERKHGDHLEAQPRDSKRYSYYKDGTTRKRPTSTYMMPYLSEFWR